MPTLPEPPKSTVSAFAPIVINCPVPAPSMVEEAAKTRLAGSLVAPKTKLELDALASPIDTAPLLPLVSTSMRGLADDEVATVHAYGLPLGMVVVELTE